MKIDLVRKLYLSVCSEVSKIVVDAEKYVKYLVISLITEGNILIEGVPGVAKTMLAKCFSKSLNLSFKRIQFTPDMLPSDVLGSFVFNQKTLEFEFKPGPIFANIVLADEINRAPPKTQSALLEAMQEKQVTMDGQTFKLPRPFMVIATQNPIEYEGTYPLPEAQVDRFMFKVSISYPESELEVLDRADRGVDEEEVEPVASIKEIIEATKLVKQIYVSKDVLNYISSLVRETRVRDKVILGGSPRSSVMLLNASKANAALMGRSYVIPDDVKEMFKPVLNHRLILKEEYLRGFEPLKAVDELLDSILNSIPPPR